MDRKNTANYEQVQKLAALVSKDYARDFLRILVMYQDISASEAAARLELHIKTAQDFLEGLGEAGIVVKREASEKKRPYFRYSLCEPRIHITIELDELYDPSKSSLRRDWRIRERKNSGALFKEGRNNRISTVQVFEGTGRSRMERKLSLTECQGRFLFHLPFPTESSLSIARICKKADIDEKCLPEIFDLIEILQGKCVIEIKKTNIA